MFYPQDWALLRRQCWSRVWGSSGRNCVAGWFLLQMEGAWTSLFRWQLLVKFVPVQHWLHTGCSHWDVIPCEIYCICFIQMLFCIARSVAGMDLMRKLSVLTGLNVRAPTGICTGCFQNSEFQRQYVLRVGSFVIYCIILSVESLDTF